MLCGEKSVFSLKSMRADLSLFLASVRSEQRQRVFIVAFEFGAK